jgi:hypothetical protein
LRDHRATPMARRKPFERLPRRAQWRIAGEIVTRDDGGQQ